MNPTILGVIGPGFLNQVPMLPRPQFNFLMFGEPSLWGALPSSTSRRTLGPRMQLKQGGGVSHANMVTNRL